MIPKAEAAAMAPAHVATTSADDIEQQVIDAVLRESLEPISPPGPDCAAVGGACCEASLAPASPPVDEVHSEIEVPVVASNSFVFVDHPVEQPMKAAVTTADVSLDIPATIKTAVATETPAPFVAMGGAGGGARGSTASAPVQAQPTSLNAVEVWARLWAKELQVLADMGFTDVPALLELLRQHVEVPCSLRPELNGEPAQDGMQRVVAALLSR